MNKHALVTGGCGFVGSHLALACARAGWSVTCLDNLSRRGSELTLRRVTDGGCRVVHGDIRNAEDLARLDGGFDLLIECSAEPSVQVGRRGADAAFMVRNNLGGTAVCLEFARARGVPILFLSTSRVYPYTRIDALRFREEATRFVCDEESAGVSAAGIAEDFPLDGCRSLYGATKLASELLIKEYSHMYGISALIDRCGVIAGPWQMGKVDQGFATLWVARHFFGRPLQYIGYGGSGKQVRDLLHVDDLVDLVLRQIARLGEFRGESFNVGGGPGHSMSLCEATALCAEVTGRTVGVEGVAETRPADVKWYVTDNARVSRAFGWTPRRPPRQVISDTLEWLKSHEADLAPLFRA
jgi:CDP-paratose 2-epimerase